MHAELKLIQALSTDPQVSESTRIAAQEALAEMADEAKFWEGAASAERATGAGTLPAPKRGSVWRDWRARERAH